MWLRWVFVALGVGVGCALVATHQPLELPANHVRALALS